MPRRPLGELRQLGIDILSVSDLPTEAMERDMQFIGLAVLRASKGWHDTPQSDEGMYCTLATNCADLKHWARQLCRAGHPELSEILNLLVDRLHQLIGSMALCG